MLAETYDDYMKGWQTVFPPSCEDLNPFLADRLAGHSLISHIFCYFYSSCFVLTVVVTSSELKDADRVVGD